jgi:hypothetical protein
MAVFKKVLDFNLGVQLHESVSSDCDILHRKPLPIWPPNGNVKSFDTLQI